MKSNKNPAMERKLLNELHSDGKRWRRLATKYAPTEALVPPTVEEEYQVVHGRLLANCQNLAGDEVQPASRRRIARQLDELLRPWSSTKSLKEASPAIVNDLMKSQTILDERLQGKSRNSVVAPLGKLLLTTCLAAGGGLFILAFLQWSSTSPTIPFFRSLQGLLTNFAAYVDQTTLTEQFAIALLCVWLFGTWLLSRLSSN